VLSHDTDSLVSFNGPCEATGNLGRLAAALIGYVPTTLAGGRFLRESYFKEGRQLMSFL
jgi:hypothetical protein